ncbi:craniofacial development protein 2-like [Clytia hemisphaerica]|uniref:craniofacial development protein 2-like n=1 Tax=Clytia hemisphaerica TaxID=252671 RepID=UPI0034D7483A
MIAHSCMLTMTNTCWFSQDLPNKLARSSGRRERDTKVHIEQEVVHEKRIRGVGIAIKVDEDILIEVIVNVDARIIVADINVKGCSLRIINCYAPTEDSSENSKSSFYSTLKKQLKVETPQKVLCIGDFNATTSAAWYTSPLRENVIINDAEVNDNGERFNEFFTESKLSVMNTWFTHKKCRKITWHSPDGKTTYVKGLNSSLLDASTLRQE